MARELPPALMSSPRPPPSWAPPWPLLLLPIAILCTVGLGIVLMAAYFFSLRDVGTGAPAGTAKVTQVTEVKARKKSHARATFTTPSGTETCTLSLADAPKLREGEEAPYYTGGIVFPRPYLAPCAERTRAEARASAPALLAAGGVDVAIGLLLLLFSRRRRRILTEGTGAVGQVISARRVGTKFVVLYRFGDDQRGRDVILRRRLAAMGLDRPPQEGDAVFVAYDPEKPRLSAIWGFSA